MWREFREFISRGNVIDLAIGVVIGAAFGKVVTSIVEDLIMPPIGRMLAGVDFKNLRVVIGSNVDPEGKVTEVAIKYGSFIQTIIEFLIIAFVIFLVVKAYNRVRRSAPASPLTPSETLLIEIRDLLRQGRG